MRRRLFVVGGEVRIGKDADSTVVDKKQLFSKVAVRFECVSHGFGGTFVESLGKLVGLLGISVVEFGDGVGSELHGVDRLFVCWCYDYYIKNLIVQNQICEYVVDLSKSVLLIVVDGNFIVDSGSCSTCF
jgi:hypothetical protein